MNTKLLVTLGPSSLKKDIVTAIDKHDIFLFRINLSHTPLEKVEETIHLIRSFSDTPICLDSEGAQVRNQVMREGFAYFKHDSLVTVHHRQVSGDSENISFTPDFVSQQLIPGDIINVDFNSVKLEVIENGPEKCIARVISGGEVGSNKAADIERDIELPSITEKDRKAIEIGRKEGIKYFALSFSSSRSEVEKFRDLTGEGTYIISKVESKKGVANIDGILEASDAILIDRGDLSRQVPIELVPFFQRRLISTAKLAEKEVFVATNLLESMIVSQQPTRAEVNDIVSTIEMGATGLVLAAETAVGKYPIGSVKMVRKLTKQFNRWTSNTSLQELLQAGVNGPESSV